MTKSLKDRKNVLPLHGSIFHGFGSMNLKRILPKTNTITRFNGTNWDSSAKTLNSKTITAFSITMSSNKTISLFRKYKTSTCPRMELSILIKSFSIHPNKLATLLWPWSQASMQVESLNYPKKELPGLTFCKIMKKRKSQSSNHTISNPSPHPIQEVTSGISVETASARVF